jgi:hypothetical protein
MSSAASAPPRSLPDAGLKGRPHPSPSASTVRAVKLSQHMSLKQNCISSSLSQGACARGLPGVARLSVLFVVVLPAPRSRANVATHGGPHTLSQHTATMHHTTLFASLWIAQVCPHKHARMAR